MSKNIVVLPVVLTCLVLLVAPVCAGVEGTWDISGTAKQRISIGGHSSGEKSPVDDQFIFGSDWTFTMIGLSPEANGTWGYVKKKFAIYVDNDYLATEITNLLIEAFQSQGYTVTIDNPAITKNIFTGKEKKDGTIKGKWNLLYTCYLYFTNFGRGFVLKYKSTITFTGVRRIGMTVVGYDPRKSAAFSSEVMADLIVDGISTGIEGSFQTHEPTSSAQGSGFAR